MLEKKYKAKEIEEKWITYWNENKIYECSENDKETFSIDTPPPTVSGDIHIGHIFSYSQTEMIARYKRLRGYQVFYPFGFDDNGLPTERLVEKKQGKKAHQIGRTAFSKLCYETTDQYEAQFKTIFSKMAVSTDWNKSYKTISPSTIKISQLSFIDLVKKGYCYHKESPVLWCNDCLTSIAQAELETKSLKTTFNYLEFKTDDNEPFMIATTRPELLPAIVAIFINPKDDKNKHLIGKNAIIPIINETIPILSDEKVDIEKGTGIVMCCTFGDQTDIEWWNKHQLPLKTIFTMQGTIKKDIKDYGGLKIKEARKKIIEDLNLNGNLKKVEEITHEVQTHERCGKEVEYTIMKQWFINTKEHKDDFIDIGNQIKWYPEHMHYRYNRWVENIMWDWCISRQRYFGVPFPVWYCKDCGKIILADIQDLPVNPLEDKLKHVCECGCHDFIAEKDVMDTWATSSLSPLITLEYNQNNSKSIVPMSLRTNASEIIRTWDFYTIVKYYYHFGIRPWDNVMISGFVMANKHEKISKSKNNSKVEPMKLIDEYSADVIRYWAGTGRLGTDIVFSNDTLLRGKKLINKLWNASKFIELHLQDFKDSDFDDFEFFDQWILMSFKEMEEKYINYLDNYEVGIALNHLEKFFWNFCDHYIEIVKHRLYRPEEFGSKARYSGQKACYMVLYKLLQDFSIFFPFITEEIYQSIYHKKASIHITEIKPFNYHLNEVKKIGDSICNIISLIRGEKTNRSLSLKAYINILELDVDEKIVDGINKANKDLKATLSIKKLLLTSKNRNNTILNIEFDTLDD